MDRARNILAETWSAALDLVYPPKCLVCGAYGSLDICPICRSGFSPFIPPLCERCGISTAGDHALCPDCAEGPGWSFAGARAAGHFSGTLRRAILRLKYGDKQRLAEPLGRFLGDYLRANPLTPEPIDLIIPVPLHTSRLLDRGFNQSALIARSASETLGVPLSEDLLVRTRRTRPQAELHASERATNVRDAFLAEESPLLRRSTLLLIDDVLTTMHTVNECARVLVDAGAKSVYVAAVARGS